MASVSWIGSRYTPRMHFDTKLLHVLGWPDDARARDDLAQALREWPEASLGRVVAQHRSGYDVATDLDTRIRSEEHTSELQSLMRISYAVFCLKKKKTRRNSMRLITNR